MEKCECDEWWVRKKYNNYVVTRANLKGQSFPYLPCYNAFMADCEVWRDKWCFFIRENQKVELIHGISITKIWYIMNSVEPTWVCVHLMACFSSMTYSNKTLPPDAHCTGRWWNLCFVRVLVVGDFVRVLVVRFVRLFPVFLSMSLLSMFLSVFFWHVPPPNAWVIFVLYKTKVPLTAKYNMHRY